MVLVGKMDVSLHLCMDYRRLNSVSRTDAYPVVRIDDLLDKLSKARFLSTLDLTKGYWADYYGTEGPAQDGFYHPIWTV